MEIDGIRYGGNDFEKKRVTHEIEIRNEMRNLYFGKCREDNFIQIYTDGSKSEDGTGAALVVMENNEPISSERFHSRRNNSVFQAELVGICEAIKWAINSEFVTGEINSDCLSAIMALENFIPSNGLIEQIFTLINNAHHKRFYLKWVKTHVGLMGNELADTCAKEAALGGDNIPQLIEDLPLSCLRFYLKREMVENWQVHWTNSDKGRKIYQVLPKVKLGFLCSNVVIGYFITGHGSFPTYLKKIGKTDDDNCICGNREDTEHFLFGKCPLIKNNFNFDRNYSMSTNIRNVIFCPLNQSKLKEIYDILNENYSFIKYRF